MGQGYTNKLTVPLPSSLGGTGSSNTATALNNLGGQPASTYLNPLANGQVGNPNIAIGGNFDTNPWARGTSFGSGNTYTADRFKIIQSGAGNLAAQKFADAPSIAQCGIGVTNCLQVAVGTATGTINAADYYMLRYQVEGYDWLQIAARPFTFSCWVKTLSAAGTICFAFNNNNQGISYIKEVNVTAGSWQQVVINVPASVVGSENYTNGVGLYVDITIASGSNYQGVANAWTTQSAKFITSNQMNGMASTSNNFRFALFKIEPGSYATPYPFESAGEVLRRCLRYYEKSYPQGTAPGTNLGTNYTDSVQAYCSKTDDLSVGFKFRVEKRAAPTMSLWAVNGTANAVTAYPNNATTAASVSISNVGTTGFSNLGTTGSILASGTAYVWHYAANADF